jgi:hydrogenase maturation protease
VIAIEPGDRLLIYGIGNPGRQDDALGARVVEELERGSSLESVTLEANYQLTPEDALLLFEHDVVIFVDATVAPDAVAPYAVMPVRARAAGSYSSHALDVATVLELCVRLYGRAPRAYALAIPGYEFEINADLSARAAENLAAACGALRALVDAATRRAATSVP